jgi:hypothetical protein
MRVLIWCWCVATIACGGLGLLSVLFGNLGDVTHFGIILTPEMRSAIYTLMVVDSGWRLSGLINN